MTTNVLDFNFNIDFLLQETFAIIEGNASLISTKPAAPGLIYRIDDGGSTFCIRAIATTNIDEEFNHINKSVLKITEDFSLENLCFFELPTVEQAEAVIEQLCNRRFPKLEDSLCNISDPGFSWWMDQQADRFEIFFRSHGINRAQKYIQLGPIGDQKVALLRMGQVQSLLRSSFPMSEFSNSNKGFAVGTLKPEHLGFKSFRDIFLKGENHTSMDNFPDNGLGRTLYFYFHELAAIRKFWIEVQTKLS
jgi:hypothetical protein